MSNRIAGLLLTTLCFTGCAVTTKRFAPEYSKEYLLAADTKVWTDCHIFTGWYSLNIGGPEKVNCLVSERYNTPPALPQEKIESDKLRMIVLQKDSLVRIKRIFTVVHEGVSSAELQVTDPETGLDMQVFAEYWPNENLNLLKQK